MCFLKSFLTSPQNTDVYTYLSICLHKYLWSTNFLYAFIFILYHHRLFLFCITLHSCFQILHFQAILLGFLLLTCLTVATIAPYTNGAQAGLFSSNSLLCVWNLGKLSLALSAELSASADFQVNSRSHTKKWICLLLTCLLYLLV